MSVTTAQRTLATPLTIQQELSQALEGESRVVFDLDGTLYDTRDFERPALAAVVDWLMNRSGRPLPGAMEALCARREGDRHRPGLFDDLLAGESLPISWGAECMQRFHAHPGAELAAACSLRRLIQELRARDCRVALVSNGKPDLQQRKLGQLGMSDSFDVAVFCDPGLPERLKPSAWAWGQLAEWRGAQPATYVGDDPVDLAFAEAGAARFVPFRYRSPAYAD